MLSSLQIYSVFEVHTQKLVNFKLTYILRLIHDFIHVYKQTFFFYDNCYNFTFSFVE